MKLYLQFLWGDQKVANIAYSSHGVIICKRKTFEKCSPPMAEMKTNSWNEKDFASELLHAPWFWYPMATCNLRCWMAVLLLSQWMPSVPRPVCTPPKTNMTMEIPPFEDVFPIENGGCSNVMLVFGRVRESLPPKQPHPATSPASAPLRWPSVVRLHLPSWRHQRCSWIRSACFETWVFFKGDSREPQ